MRLAAAALAVLLLLATAASADLYRGHAATKEAKPSLTLRTATDRTARIQSGSVAIGCANGARVLVRLDVRVTLRSDSTFMLARTEQLTLKTTGAATSREQYRGAVSGRHARLHFTDTIKGPRATCRADVRFTLSRSS